MLRISVENGPLTTRFKLEGKLAHEWVSEAEKAWVDLRARHGKKKVIIDLFDVSFVDDLGHQLLGEMQSAGAQLIGSGPMISALIEEIHSESELQLMHDKKAETGHET
jgi:anti-anti-sigma regulatory factor